jgi:predicted enzyme related to lactoylglutathione lyase
MHRSRLRQFVLDFAPEDFQAGTDFWAAAVGAEQERDPQDPDYTELRGHPGDLAILTQRLGDGPSRIHLDIEADDVDAEVARLRQLGATEVERISSWVVMRDPAGVLFCVINAQDGFDAAAASWD